MVALVLRRRKLGRTSAREISNRSATGIIAARMDENINWNDIDLVFRWGTTSNLPKKVKVINEAAAIHKVADKAGFRKELIADKLCLSTYYSVKELEEEENENLEGGVIVRPKTHAQGRHVYLCKTPEEVQEAIRKCGEGFYISKFIDKVAEYRIFVVSGRVVCVANKIPADAKAVAWNVARGGKFENVRWDDWPLKACKVAIAAFDKSGLDFGGIDVMVDKDGEAYVLEANSACSLTSPYRQECFAKAFDYIVNNGNEKIPLHKERGGYLKFIHPAINNNARV